ncbi:MAG: hypothetical protein FLDDKLPJ_01999 [Phycisphaerae bacterium]|nr:hypothetical protein [Phycisphaerae bacterium]
MKKKEFDCVEMKRQGAERIRQRLEGLSREQVEQYWKEQTEELRRLQAELRAKRTAERVPV